MKVLLFTESQENILEGYKDWDLNVFLILIVNCNIRMVSI